MSSREGRCVPCKGALPALHGSGAAMRRSIAAMRRSIAAILVGAVASLIQCPALGADIALGASLYTKNCAVCHGANGIAVFPGAPSFARMERLMQPDPVLLNSVRFGKRSMPGFAATLKDQEILDVIAYIRTIR
jgi:cytochrome c6